MFTALEPATYPWGDYRRYSFSLGINTGSDLVVCGTTASRFDPQSRQVVIEGGAAEQANTIYDKIEVVLEAGGHALSDVVRVVEYIDASIADEYPIVEAVRNERVHARDVACSTICVDRLLRPDAKVEISVLARCRAQSTAALLYLPTLLPRDLKASAAAQFQDVLSVANSTLDSLGLTWRDVVFVDEHVAASVEVPTLLDRAHDFEGATFAGSRVRATRLLDPAAAVQIDLVASREPVTPVTGVDVPGLPAALVPAARSGNRLFVSSTSGGDADASVEAQVELAYQRVLDVVGHAGGGPQDIVDTVEYITAEALSDYSATADIRRRMLSRPYPVATGTVCRRLDGGADFVVHAFASL